MYILVLLKFTPLEFETTSICKITISFALLKFTPLEFETVLWGVKKVFIALLKFTPLEFETFASIFIYFLFIC